MPGGMCSHRGPAAVGFSLIRWPSVVQSKTGTVYSPCFLVLMVPDRFCDASPNSGVSEALRPAP